MNVSGVGVPATGPETALKQDMEVGGAVAGVGVGVEDASGHHPQGEGKPSNTSEAIFLKSLNAIKYVYFLRVFDEQHHNKSGD